MSIFTGHSHLVLSFQMINLKLERSTTGHQLFNRFVKCKNHNTFCLCCSCESNKEKKLSNLWSMHKTVSFKLPKVYDSWLIRVWIADNVGKNVDYGLLFRLSVNVRIRSISQMVDQAVTSFHDLLLGENQLIIGFLNRNLDSFHQKTVLQLLQQKST